MADLKKLARQIFHQTLAAIDIPAAMQRKLIRSGTYLRCDACELDLRDFDRVRVIAIGKAAYAMVQGLSAVLGDSLELEGVVAAPENAPGSGDATKAIGKLKYFAAGH